MSLDQDFLRSIDIVALVSEYVTLRRHGREYQGLCPFHSERSPSFSVNPDKGFYYCHGCHEGGNAIQFLAKMEGIGAGQAARMLAERQGLTLSDSTRTEEQEAHRSRLFAACTDAARFYQEQISAPEAEHARQYLRSRGIDRSCAGAFGLGYAPAAPDLLLQHLRKRGFSQEEAEEAGLCAATDDGPRDRMRDRLILPIADSQGRIIAFGGRALGTGTPKYLNSPDTPLFHKSRTLYLLHRARRAMQRDGSVVVVEGYLDALMAHHYGFENVVATLGTAITADHVRVLQRLTRRVVFALDSDEAGVRAVEKAAALFADADMDIRVASVQAGMDPDAYLRSYGPDAFRERLTQAVGVVEYRLATLLKSADLGTPEGKTTALQQCIKVLAGVSSPMLRDRYVDDLARLWVGALATGETVLDNIELVRAEIARQAHRELGPRRRSASHRLADVTASQPQLETEQSQAEAGLLAALLQQPSLLRRVGELVTEEDFRDAQHRAIYRILIHNLEQDVDQDPDEPLKWFSALDDEALIQAGARLLAVSDTIVNAESTVVDCIRKVKDFDRRARFEELRRKFDEMAAGVQDAIAGAELEEYYQLSRYLKPGSAAA